MAKERTKYRYSGPLNGVTLDDGSEVMLHTGSEVSLPADNDYVKALCAQRFLTEIKAEEAPAQEPPKPQAKNTQTSGTKEVNSGS